MAVVAVLFALPEEAAPLQRMLRGRCGTAPAVGISGIGPDRAAEAAVRLLDSSGAGALLIAGFAGSLSRHCPPGSLVVPRRVHAGYGPSTPDALPDAGVRGALVTAAEKCGAAPAVGGIVTEDHVLRAAAEKAAAATATGAIAVDMETFAAARAAEINRVPWAAARVVTDAFDEELPLDFAALAGASGRIPPMAVAGAALRRPAVIPALLQLGRRSTDGARLLASVLAGAAEALAATAP